MSARKDWPLEEAQLGNEMPGADNVPVCPICRVELVYGLDNDNYSCPLCQFNITGGYLKQFMGTSRMYSARSPVPLVLARAAIELPQDVAIRVEEQRKRMEQIKRNYASNSASASYRMEWEQVQRDVQRAISGTEALIVRVPLPISNPRFRNLRRLTREDFAERGDILMDVKDREAPVIAVYTRQITLEGSE